MGKKFLFNILTNENLEKTAAEILQSILMIFWIDLINFFANI